MELTRSVTHARMNYKKKILTINQAGEIKNVLIGKFKNRKKLTKQSIDFSYLNLGYYIITPLILGVFLGLAVDHWFKTKPLFVSIFLFLGTIACFYNLIRLLKDGKRTSY